MRTILIVFALLAALAATPTHASPYPHGLHWTLCTLTFGPHGGFQSKGCTRYAMPKEHRTPIGHSWHEVRRTATISERVTYPRFAPPAPVQTVTQPAPVGIAVSVSVSAYAPGCGASGAMASGQWPFVGAAAGTFPFGTRIYVPGWGMVTVLDRGVPGGYLDLYMPSCSQAVQWGRRVMTVQVYS